MSITIQLCYTALSPFCRKVRMALDFKQLPCRIVQVDRIADLPVPSPRAEVPVLADGDTVVCNSPDILAYLDRLQPAPALYPGDAAGYAEVRRWELLADTRLDAVMSVVGVFRLMQLELPAPVQAGAAAELAELYDALDAQLAGREHLCGGPSAADVAAYPHVAAGAALGWPCDRAHHPHLLRWLRQWRERPEGRADNEAVRAWWSDRGARPVDVERINWGAHRLEWLLAHGQADWFAEQVRADRVLWSVGPRRQALQRR